MKISVDDQELFTLSETQKLVIQNDIHSDFFDSDMKRRIKYILMHKYERCLERMKKEWDEKLKANAVESIPLDPDKYAELVFSQPNYKNRAKRDIEEKTSNLNIS